MRLSIGALAIIACAVMAIGADKERWVTAKNGEVGVYASEIRQTYEKPIFSVSSTARMKVLSEGRDMLKVTANGQEGWIEKGKVATASSKAGKTFTFEDADVVGYLDNPTPVYIIDAENQEKDPIKLERSFADALKDNTDQETVDRQSK